MEDRRERKADQRRREGTAENHDRRMEVEEHSEFAAHDDKTAKDDSAGDQTEARCDIHRDPHPYARATRCGGALAS